VLVPCPLSVSGTFNVDMSLLPPGKHLGRLLIFDASDGPPLERDFEFSITDPTRPGASCATDRSATIRVSPTPIGYGRHRLRFSVKGLPALPRQAAVMDVQANLSVIGTATLKNGRYVAQMSATRPRLLRIAFPLVDGTVVCSQAVQLSVRAGLRLSVAPSVVSNGSTIYLRGRLSGGVIAGHRPVEIQARATGGPRRWTLVRVVRTNTRGRFRMSYTFKRTFDRVQYQFRAVQKGGDGFPYAFGASKREMVLVRGS
jgi:hypothetical protein